MSAADARCRHGSSAYRLGPQDRVHVTGPREGRHLARDVAQSVADGSLKHLLITSGLITSGGYGLLLADEPIGNYTAPLKLGRWPNGILKKVLGCYARGMGIIDVRAFAPTSGHDARLVTTVPWRSYGVRQGWLYTPAGAHGDGALLKVPRTEGEAFTALLAGKLGPGWKSSDGLFLTVRRVA